MEFLCVPKAVAKSPEIYTSLKHVNCDYRQFIRQCYRRDRPKLRFLSDFAVSPDDCSFNQYSARHLSAKQLRTCHTGVNRQIARPLITIIALIVYKLNSDWRKLIRFKIGRPANCTRAKNMRDALNERNTWHRKMNDNVISVRGSNEKYTTDLPNTRRVLQRLEIPGVKRLMFQLSIYTVHRASGMPISFVLVFFRSR